MFAMKSKKIRSLRHKMYAKNSTELLTNQRILTP